MSRRLRSVAAWVGASAVAAIVGFGIDVVVRRTRPFELAVVTGPDDPLSASARQPPPNWFELGAAASQVWVGIFFAAAIVGGLAQLGIVAVLRRLRAPRPYWDALAAGLLLPIAVAELTLFLASGGGDLLSAFDIALLQMPYFACALTTGFAYWLLAGRPKPPYA